MNFDSVIMGGSLYHLRF